MDRRTFLSLTACGILRRPIGFARPETVPEGYWKTEGYRAIQVLHRVSQIFIQRSENVDGLFVEFVDHDTMPHSNVRLVVPCASSELGLHIVGSISYQLSLWFQQRTSSVEASIEPEAAAAVTLLAHADRGRDVVVVLERDDGEGGGMVIVKGSRIDVPQGGQTSPSEVERGQRNGWRTEVPRD